MSEERPPADGEVAIPGGRQGPGLKPRLGRSDSSEVHAQEDETEKMKPRKLREHSYLYRDLEGMSVTGIQKTKQMQKGTIINSRENTKL